MTARPNLLACAVLFALSGASGAWAQESQDATTEAAPAAGAEAPRKMTAEELEQVMVKLSIVGLGETRQVQRMDAAESERYPAGTSLLKLLDRLPGVHFTNADAQGSYGWAKRLSIRGFTQNQLGFTLDRVPLGDQSYGNHNGLHIGRAIIAENLGVLELSQGGGSLDTASTSNLGGTVRITSDEPGYDLRVRLDQTVGSDNTLRSYARLDTGDMRGWRTFLSAMHQDGDKWKGWGPQRQNQFNAKTTREFGSAVFTTFIGASRRAETDYADYSLESQRTRGWGWDNYAPDWQAAIDVANNFQCRTANPTPRDCDDAYYLGRGLRDDNIGYVTLDWTASDTISLITTAYKHSNEGQGHWVTPYIASSPSLPLALRASEYEIDRWGILPTLTMFMGDHKIEAGFWIERNDHSFFRNAYQLQLSTPPNRAAFLENPFQRLFAANFQVDTLQYFIQDKISLMDGRLTVDLGFKGVDVDYDSRRLYGTRFAEGTISAKDSFLPKAAVRWGFTDQIEGFLAYGENISVYRAGVAGLFETSQLGFDAIKDALQPETSRTVEGGFRLVNDRFEGSVIAYDVLFENRLLRITQGSGILAGQGTLANVGSVETRGIELAGLWHVAEGFDWYNSIAYNNSEYADNYQSGNPPATVPTAGKTVVDSPKWLASSNLNWTHGNWDLRLGAKYTSERYYTFTNDAEVPGYTIANFALIYRLNELSWANFGKIQFNITNLLDKKHFSTIGSNPFVPSDPSGVHWNLQEGAERQFFLTFSVDL